VSTEILAIVVSAIGIALTLGTSLFAAGVWMVRRIDDRIDAVDDKLTARIDAVATDVTDLKISVARLEGPPRHLLTAGS
jgi:outer membrane murein-binding lipoprotein Lpp